MSKKDSLGEKGEEIAFHHLIKKGYKVKARNWRYNHKEIDIIATHEDMLVFVEVKTRSAAIYESAQDAISDQKIRFLVNAADAYIMEHEIDSESRFDVIMIKWYGENRYDIDHITSAFTPTA